MSAKDAGHVLEEHVDVQVVGVAGGEVMLPNEAQGVVGQGMIAVAGEKDDVVGIEEAGLID